MPSPQTVVPMDGTAESSKALKVSYASSFFRGPNLVMYIYTLDFHFEFTVEFAIELLENVQPPQFIPEPRPKRCATHNYIACNIRLHQQFTKTNHFWPATAGSAALCGAKPKDLNAMPPAENMIIGSTLQGSFPFVNLNPAQDKVQAVANIPVFTRKDRSSESTLIETAQKQQLVLPQPPHPAPAGNLMVWSYPVQCGLIFEFTI